MQPITRLEELESKILSQPIPPDKGTYTCSFIDDHCIVFQSTPKTGKVMIPTDVALEWIMAYEFGITTLDDDPRRMRDKVKEFSSWASYHHGFETHLHAIVKAWSKS